jgi:hypothetical protein
MLSSDRPVLVRITRQQCQTIRRLPQQTHQQLATPAPVHPRQYQSCSTLQVTCSSAFALQRVYHDIAPDSLHSGQLTRHSFHVFCGRIPLCRCQRTASRGGRKAEDSVDTLSVFPLPFVGHSVLMFLAVHNLCGIFHVYSFNLLRPPLFVSGMTDILKIAGLTALHRMC